MSAPICSNSGDGLIAPLLDAVDCQIAHYVEGTYASLFGPFGSFEPVLTGALTLYIAFYGYQLILGRGGLSLSGLAPKILLIGAVLAFSTRWGAYQALFLNLFYGGAEELASLMLGGQQDVFVRLDGVLQEIIRIANEWNVAAINQPDAIGAAPASALPPVSEQSSMPRGAGAVNLLWFSAIALSLSTVGVLIIAKILLGLLLAVGPLLVVSALFGATRGLFEGWLKTLSLYALVACFATVLAGGLLALVEPMVQNIADARATGLADPQPVFVLAVTAFIFALLMGQVLRMCGKITGAWRLPAANIHPSVHDYAGEQQTQARQQFSENGRVADIVVAIERSSGSAPHRAASPSTNAASSQSPPSSANRRTGQEYRVFDARLGARGRFA